MGSSTKGGRRRYQARGVLNWTGDTPGAMLQRAVPLLVPNIRGSVYGWAWRVRASRRVYCLGCLRLPCAQTADEMGDDLRGDCGSRIALERVQTVGFAGLEDTTPA